MFVNDTTKVNLDVKQVVCAACFLRFIKQQKINLARAGEHNRPIPYDLEILFPTATFNNYCKYISIAGNMLNCKLAGSSISFVS